MLSLLLGQAPHPLPDPEMTGFVWWIDGIGALVSLGYFALLFYMLFHCYRSEPDKYFWFWIILVVQPFGLAAYILLRFLPSRDFELPVQLKLWTRQRELARLEFAAEQIGNPYQYILWGDALRDVKQFDRAQQAYQQALIKDPKNMQALWGAAQVAMIQKRYEDARSLTGQILEEDPDYKFGDVLLAHARALNELGDQEAALRHFEQHVRRWRHPESLYLLAEIHEKRGDQKAARECLTTLIKDINASPAAIARKYGRWKSRANRLLRKLAA